VQLIYKTRSTISMSSFNIWSTLFRSILLSIYHVFSDHSVP